MARMAAVIKRKLAYRDPLPQEITVDLKDSESTFREDTKKMMPSREEAKASPNEMFPM
jgi:hypothetical protein